MHSLIQQIFFLLSINYLTLSLVVNHVRPDYSSLIRGPLQKWILPPPLFSPKNPPPSPSYSDENRGRDPPAV